MMRHVAANALTLLILGLVVLFGAVTWAQREYRARGPLEAPLVLVVDRGESLGSVTEKLLDEGAIERPRLFRIAARYAEMDDGLKFGEYEIPAGASMQAILELLNQGSNVARQIVIPEGWTSWQVVEALRAREDLSGEIAEVPSEGTLAPAGYDYELEEERQAILERMAAEQERILAEAWEGRDADLPLSSPEELLILASIVEKETGLPEERAQVAGVFVNRLRQGMRLQTDPTVVYGITKGRETLGRGLRAAELATSTPFNTYVISGLPPSPIANPGREAIAAAANPAEVEWLYFVADGSGGHAFAETLLEHNANVIKWRRLEAERARAAEEEAAAEGEGEEEVVGQ